MALKETEVNKGSEDKNGSMEAQNAAMLAEMKKELEALKKDKGQGSAPVENMEAFVEKLVTGLNRKTDFEKYGNGKQYVSEVDMDPEDILSDEDAETFFVHSTGYVVVDDLRNGLPVLPPFGPIEFKYQSTKKVRTGKDIDLFHISAYTSKNKKEVAWLTKHSMYNAIFFLKSDSAMLTDSAKKAAKIAKFMSSLKLMGQADLFNAAKANGIQFTEDINSMRVILADYYADKEIKKEIELTKTTLAETMKDQMLLDEKGTSNSVRT